MAISRSVAISALVAALLLAVWLLVAPPPSKQLVVSPTRSGSKLSVVSRLRTIKRQQLEEIEEIEETEERSAGGGSGDDAELEVENGELPGSLITQSNESDQENAALQLCPEQVGSDHIPCLDNNKAIKKLRTTKHYEHRERHCPSLQDEENQPCLLPLPEGYKARIPWPRSRDEVWFNNVPHLGLVSYKADQQWVKQKGELLVFPGGGTQYKKGAMHYINFVEKTLPQIAWGKRTRVILDVGCGVASFGGYLFDKDALALSFAPKDEHDAQVQLALERGIPAMLAVMGTQQLPFPSNVYDVVHCARCRVPWHRDGGKLLIELNRLIRPGGYFVWSATPVYQREPEDIEIWKETTAWAAKLCWKRIARTRDVQTGIGVAIFQKPTDNTCYMQREVDVPPLCEHDQESAGSWYVPLQGCISKLPTDPKASSWPKPWPARLKATPKWSPPNAQEFQLDARIWKRTVQELYERKLGIDWDGIRNVMDMNAGYGGFAAALAGLPLWVMNVVPTSEPDTLGIIFDRGLLGIYHDWCESFSTYPRTYDLLHVDHLVATLKRCTTTFLFAEMDRILRPGGWVVFRDTAEVLQEVEALVLSLHWEVKQSSQVDQEDEEVSVLAARKTEWRPEASSV